MHIRLWTFACLCLWLAACATTPTPGPTAITPTVDAPAGTSEPAGTLPASETSTPAGSRVTLTIWLPPEFAPDSAAPAGRVLSEQLAEYEQEHPGRFVDVRLKQASGSGGLLRSLVAAYNVAPAVLPDLVALNQDDLRAAAAAGLLTPLDTWVPPDVMADYYPFAQEMGHPGGTPVGLPFAADARVLAYRTDIYSAPPHTWPEVVTGTLVFPAAEAYGLTVLQEYLAAGGLLYDPSGKLVLDTEILAETLASLQQLQTAGILPVSTLAYTDTVASWQVLRERRATAAVTSASMFLSEQSRLEASAVTWIPSAEGSPFALAEGWSWAMMNAAPERHADAAELLLWLTQPGRMAAWTTAADMLPPRSAALNGWNASRARVATAALTGARLRPSAEALAVVGPVLRRALEDVLNQRATPFAAAMTASQSVNRP